MRVLLLLPRFNRALWRSVESQFWSIAQGLRDSGVQCVIAAGRSADEAAMEVVGDIPIYRFVPGKPRPLWLRRLLSKQKKSSTAAALPQQSSQALETFLRKNRFDLIHLAAGGELASSVVQIAQQLNVPVIMNCSNAEMPCKDMALWSSERSSINSPQLFRTQMQRELGTLHRASMVLCNERNLTKALQQELPQEKVVYFPPGVEFEYFNRPAQVDFRQFYQIPPQRSILLSVGGITESKNQKCLLDTLNVLNRHGRNCHLVILGPAVSGDYYTDLQKLVDKRGLSGHLTIIPGLPPGDERFKAAYQAASLVILPSRFEVSGSTVLEAWAAGAPVLCTPVGSGADLIEDSVTGRISLPQRFNEWIGICEEQLDERLRIAHEKVRTQASNRAKQHNWKVQCAELIKIYQQCIDDINQHKEE